MVACRLLAGNDGSSKKAPQVFLATRQGRPGRASAPAEGWPVAVQSTRAYSGQAARRRVAARRPGTRTPAAPERLPRGERSTESRYTGQAGLEAIDGGPGGSDQASGARAASTSRGRTVRT